MSHASFEGHHDLCEAFNARRWLVRDDEQWAAADLSPVETANMLELAVYSMDH